VRLTRRHRSNTPFAIMRRGVGQDTDVSSLTGDSSGSGNTTIPLSTFGTTTPIVTTSQSGSLDSIVPEGTCTGPGCMTGAVSAGSTSSLASAISALVAGGVKAYQTSQVPAGYFINPSTGQLVNSATGLTVGSLGTTLSSLFPMLLLIGGVILVISVMEHQ
jgi:hypothetical protein